MKRLRTLTALAATTFVAAAFAVSAYGHSAHSLSAKITTRVESPAQQTYTGRLQVRKGTQVLRFLHNHPTAGTYRSHQQVRRNYLWLLHQGHANLVIAARRLAIIAEARREEAAREAAARQAREARARAANWLTEAFMCIHRYEGSWTSNTGNGYYGGLQMDMDFQGTYGSSYLKQWGTADNWPVWAQIDAAARAYHSGRGFGPWPNTARACGLL